LEELEKLSIDAAVSSTFIEVKEVFKEDSQITLRDEENDNHLDFQEKAKVRYSFSKRSY
jgi:hypothetical protein